VTVKKIETIGNACNFTHTGATEKFYAPSSVGVIYLRELEKRKMLNELSIKKLCHH